MSIAAKISAAELVAQVTDRYVDEYYEGILLHALGTTYQPGVTSDSDFLTNEVTAGLGGYTRQVIKYINTDVGAYADDGVALATKATVFAHDGSSDVTYFTHAALIKGNGNVTLCGAATAAPSYVDSPGTHDGTNIPLTTSGDGIGLVVDLVIANTGSNLSDYSFVIVKPGYGYAAGDLLQIEESTLIALGVTAVGAGPITFSVDTVTVGGGAVVAVAKTESEVALTNGNEAAFHWNIKQYGFYTV